MARVAALDDTSATICLTGPESTGKTTLATLLAEQLGARLVPEVARGYLNAREPADTHIAYAREDLLEIARQQMALETEAREQGGLVVCDTDVLVIAIWWQEKFGPLPASLQQAMDERTPRSYLLLSPDLPWVADPQRENPADRTRLFDLYKAELAGSEFPYAVIQGAGDARLAQALLAVEKMLS